MKIVRMGQVITPQEKVKGHWQCWTCKTIYKMHGEEKHVVYSPKEDTIGTACVVCGSIQTFYRADSLLTLKERLGL